MTTTEVNNDYNIADLWEELGHLPDATPDRIKLNVCLAIDDDIAAVPSDKDIAANVTAARMLGIPNMKSPLVRHFTKRLWQWTCFATTALA